MAVDDFRALQTALEVWVQADQAAAAADPVVDEAAANAAAKDAAAAVAALKASLAGEAEEDDDGEAALRRRLGAVVQRLNGDNPPEDSGELRKWIREALFPSPRPPRSVAEINDPLPQPLLMLAGQRGALLTRGAVGIVAGEGGIGKSALICGLACDVASSRDTGPFEAVPGPVLMVAYEDDAATVAWRCRAYWRAVQGAGNPLQHVHVTTPGGALFGPQATDSGAELYNARPDRLAAWHGLEHAIEAVQPVLVVIDPALEAYAADQNNGSAVREFLRALRQLAGRYQIGILLVAHSSKSARAKGQQDDPFRVGQIAGSSHWVDGCRSAVALDWSPGGDDPFRGRRLACIKANYGPSRLVCEVDPIRAESGSIVGFTRELDGWKQPAAPESKQGGRNGDAKATAGQVC